MAPMTPWVKRLLIANLVVFFLLPYGSPIYQRGMFIPSYFLYQPWTAVTYMFLHAGFQHVFFNMLGLFFFGPRIEQRLGGKDFLWLYFLSGLGGAFLSIFFAPNNPIVGASGAVYGVLLAFALYWPMERIYLWMILPVPAWLLASLMVLGSLYSGFSGAGAGTAHFAHLGGLAAGFSFIRWRDWKRGSAKRDFQKKLDVGGGGGLMQDRAALARWEMIDVSSLHELNREEVVMLLALARKDGVKSLSHSQRQFMERMSLAR